MISVILLSIWILASVFDAVTTHVAVSHPGIVEANPLLQNPKLRDAIILAIAALGAWATVSLVRSGDVGQAIFFTGLTAAVHVWAGVHNLLLVEGKK